MLFKYSGKYVNIYFNMKITYCPWLPHPAVQFLHITVYEFYLTVLSMDDEHSG